MNLQGFALALALSSGPVAADEVPPCPDGSKPVVTLGFGSRYAADSATRSDFDEEGDKAVTAALKPIDDFIADLARQTDLLHDPGTSAEQVQQAAACVQRSILRWVRADALSDLASQGANLSAPSRVGGIAFAYEAVRRHLPDAPENAEIDDWLRKRAAQTMAYFDEDAPPRASQNNLRAWAGLAVTRIGLTLEDPALINWGAASARLVACTAQPDGSLPNEMWRGKLALHYQLHAVAPLVMTAALLETRHKGLFQACNRAIPRIVDFTLAALDDPAAVKTITGKPQSVGGRGHPPRDFELAWVPAYLQFNPDPDLDRRVQGIKQLGNSKLGGNQRLIWPNKKTDPQKLGE